MSTDMRRPELHRLSVPFPPQFVATKEGADYVNHAIVQQRILGSVGPFSMRVDQVIRGDFDEKVTGRGPKERTWPARTNAVVGVVLTCTFTIDGEQVEVSEIGTPEGHYMSAHDGERLKKAVSDALKRCAMRVGVGLDLWSKGSYVLPAMLEKDTVEAEATAPAPEHDAPDPDDVDTEPVAVVDEQAPADEPVDEPELRDPCAEGQHRPISNLKEGTNECRRCGVHVEIDTPELTYAERLSDYNKDDLAGLCRDRGLPVSSNKPDLIKRLVTYEQETSKAASATAEEVAPEPEPSAKESTSGAATDSEQEQEVVQQPSVGEDGEAEPADGDHITHEQRKHLFALFAEHGITEQQRKTIVVNVYGLPSMNDLRAGQATKLIESLSKPGGPADFKAAADDYLTEASAGEEAADAPDPTADTLPPGDDGQDDGIPSPAEHDGPFDWQAYATERGVGVVQVLKALHDAWPSNDQAAKPARKAQIDDLAVKDEPRVRAAIDTAAAR